jgi:hypothetical protein
MNKKIILQRINENKQDIKNFQVKKIGLFGSYVKDKQKKSSDIDILVEFEDNEERNYFRLWEFLERLFNNKKIDLIIESGLKPRVKYVTEEAEYVKI